MASHDLPRYGVPEIDHTDPMWRRGDDLPWGAPVAGVYLLILGSAVVYAGESVEIRKRIGEHERRLRKAFDNIRWVPLKDLRIRKVLEAECIYGFDTLANGHNQRLDGASWRQIEEILRLAETDMTLADIGARVRMVETGVGRRLIKMGYHRMRTPEELEILNKEILRLAETDIPYAEIGELMGLRRDVVSERLIKMGYRRSRTPEELEISDREILRLDKTDMTPAEIGELMGLSAEVVRQRRRKMRAAP